MITSIGGTRLIDTINASSVALGCAALTFDHHDDPARGAAVVNAALDAGITVLDTAAAYTTASRDHANEKLIRNVLATRRAGSSRPFVATKGGHYRDGDTFPIDARPATLRRHCTESLAALGIEQIDLYFLHWPDPNVPIEESVGELAQLCQEGKIARIGVSNVGLTELDAAQRTASIAAVQNHFSVFDQSGGDVVDHCATTGTAFLAYSPLRGLTQASPDLRHGLDEIATAHEVSPARIALAWLLARSPNLIPVVGATRPQTARDAASASSVALTESEAQSLSR